MSDETHMKRCVSVQEHGSTDLSTGQLVCRRFLSQSEASSPGRDRRDVRRETGRRLRSPAHRGGQAPSVYSALWRAVYIRRVLTLTLCLSGCLRDLMALQHLRFELLKLLQNFGYTVSLLQAIWVSTPVLVLAGIFNLVVVFILRQLCLIVLVTF